jgi:hypothetical protein
MLQFCQDYVLGRRLRQLLQKSELFLSYWTTYPRAQTSTSG